MQNKIIDFKTVVGHNSDFDRECMKLISEGYTPLGSTTVRPGSGTFVISLVKYEENEREINI